METRLGNLPGSTQYTANNPPGVLPYMAGLGMCRCDAGYGFQAVYSGVRNNNNNNCLFLLLYTDKKNLQEI